MSPTELRYWPPRIPCASPAIFTVILGSLPLVLKSVSICPPMRFNPINAAAWIPEEQLEATFSNPTDSSADEAVVRIGLHETFIGKSVQRSIRDRNVIVSMHDPRQTVSLCVKGILQPVFRMGFVDGDLSVYEYVQKTSDQRVRRLEKAVLRMSG